MWQNTPRNQSYSLSKSLDENQHKTRNMKRIYRYTLQISPKGIRCKMPANAVITTAEMTESGLNVWALVDKNAEDEWRHFHLHKTGEDLPDSIADCLHIKTLVTRVLTKEPTYDGDPPEFRTLVDHLWQIDARTAKALQTMQTKKG